MREAPMTKRANPLITIGLLLILIQSPWVRAESIKIAVASNFAATLEDLINAYQMHSSTQFSLSSASTGKHYAQIYLGAPFDAFFAADNKRPQKLLNQNIGHKNSLTTYAKGRLVLWSHDTHPVFQKLQTSAEPQTILSHLEFKHLATADPKVAPYGAAAQDALMNLKLFDQWSQKMVFGENIGQTFNMVYSRAANFGFVAYSQALTQTSTQNYWLLPNTLHRDISQTAIILRDSPAIRNFFHYLNSHEAQSIIQAAGYDSKSTPLTQESSKDNTLKVLPKD